MISELRILVLDDEAIVADAIGDMLNDVGIKRVTTCYSPEEAMCVLKDFNPHIIFSDIEMGEIDGFKFVEDARSEFGKLKNTAIIFLTGHSNHDIVEKAKALKVAGYLLKPVSFDKLKASIFRVTNALAAQGKL